MILWILFDCLLYGLTLCENGPNTDALTARIHVKNITIGILQGDSLSIILYVLSVNPASFLLERTQQGYELGEAFRQIINHLFFVDDLKLYARSKQMACYC